MPTNNQTCEQTNTGIVYSVTLTVFKRSPLNHRQTAAPPFMSLTVSLINISKTIKLQPGGMTRNVTVVWRRKELRNPSNFIARTLMFTRPFVVNDIIYYAAYVYIFLPEIRSQGNVIKKKLRKLREYA